MSMIKTENICKNFGELQVLKNVSLTVEPQEVVCIIGPSGAGKSTYLRTLNHLEKINHGKIYIEDKLLDHYENSERKFKLPSHERQQYLLDVGMVFQRFNLFPHKTVLENVMIAPVNVCKVPVAKAKETAVDLLNRVGLGDKLEFYPAQLSGGQQQRVAIARSLVKMPNVLLLDEPLSNLDARLRLQTREQIRRIQQETGITTIFVTHDQEEAMSICDMIVLMKDGIVNQIGKPQDIYDNPANLFVAKFLGTPAINVFRGYIRDKGLYIGDNRLADFEADDQEVSVAIRPEGFIVDEKGTFKCKYERTQVMGRDISIICHNENCISDEDIRAIVPSDIRIEDRDEIRFSLKPNKVFVFDSMERRLCSREII